MDNKSRRDCIHPRDSRVISRRTVPSDYCSRREFIAEQRYMRRRSSGLPSSIATAVYSLAILALGILVSFINHSRVESHYESSSHGNATFYDYVETIEPSNIFRVFGFSLIAYALFSLFIAWHIRYNASRSSTSDTVENIAAILCGLSCGVFPALCGKVSAKELFGLRPSYSETQIFSSIIIGMTFFIVMYCVFRIFVCNYNGIFDLDNLKRPVRLLLAHIIAIFLSGCFCFVGSGLVLILIDLIISIYALLPYAILFVLFLLMYFISLLFR